MRSPNLKPDSNFANRVLAFVVISSTIGLIGFAWIDESTRPSFLEVAKMAIAAYLGYWLGK
ncbi:hypothetical protein [Brunnivagina elsteri]|uniref:Uncharacterized protein n=1 Tax=Brunnivagina elsteri CCALA 953 TaxID=987040 RepID=A0A2A2TMK2_9CYAN|nr:hypothetical protein [Calothrix elsteri]PAX59776.1 hypothetical protein CK510_05130 [Calothrix elsteri CCALA 953]